MRLSGKRVVFVLGDLELGGAERQAILLARQLAGEAGADVQVWGFEHPHGRAAALCQEYGIPCRYVPFRWHPWRGGRRAWISQLMRFAWQLRRERPDAVLSYYTLPNIVCGLTWRLTGAKICLWNQRDEGASVLPELEPWAVRLTRAFAANSPGGARYLAETFGVPIQAIHIVPNGVELAPAVRNRQQWRAQLGLGTGQFAASMIANLTERKDHPTLLRAWRNVVDHFSADAPPVLLLAGEPTATGAALRSLAAELGIEPYIRFLGQVADVTGLLQAIDLGIHCSPQEGCPNAVLEMMAAGLSVVATDIDGIRMALGEEAAPFLSPNGDPAALADRILLLAQNAALRQTVGEANRRRAQREFSPQQMLDRMLAILSNT